MTLRRRMEFLIDTGHPKSAREKRLGKRFSRQDKVIRWIGAANRRRTQDETVTAVSAVPVSPSAEVIVLTWKQTFGRSAICHSVPTPVASRGPSARIGSNLLAFRVN